MFPWPVTLEFAPEWSLPNTCIFSAMQTTAFLPLETLDSTSALYLGATLNSKTTVKRTCAYRMSCHKKAEHCLADLNWEHAHGATLMSPSPAHVCDWSTLLIWGLQIHFSEQMNSQIKIPRIMRNNYVKVFKLTDIFNKNHSFTYSVTH